MIALPLRLAVAAALAVGLSACAAEPADERPLEIEGREVHGGAPPPTADPALMEEELDIDQSPNDMIEPDMRVTDDGVWDARVRGELAEEGDGPPVEVPPPPEDAIEVEPIPEPPLEEPDLGPPPSDEDETPD